MTDEQWIAQARKEWPRLDAVLTYAEALARSELMNYPQGNAGGVDAIRIQRNNLRLLIADLMAEQGRPPAGGG